MKKLYILKAGGTPGRGATMPKCTCKNCAAEHAASVNEALLDAIQRLRPRTPEEKIRAGLGAYHEVGPATRRPDLPAAPAPAPPALKVQHPEPANEAARNFRRILEQEKK